MSSKSGTDLSTIQVGGFSLATPDGWQVVSLIMIGPSDSNGEAAPGTTSGQFQKNLVVVTEMTDGEDTLANFVQKQTEKLKEQNALHRPPGPLEKVILAGGRQAVIFEHVVLGPAGEKVRQMQLLSLNGKALHALIASHLDGLLFESHRDEFHKILTSAKLP